MILLFEDVLPAVSLGVGFAQLVHGGLHKLLCLLLIVVIAEFLPDCPRSDIAVGLLLQNPQNQLPDPLIHILVVAHAPFMPILLLDVFVELDQVVGVGGAIRGFLLRELPGPFLDLVLFMHNDPLVDSVADLHSARMLVEGVGRPAHRLELPQLEPDILAGHLIVELEVGLRAVQGLH